MRKGIEKIKINNDYKQWIAEMKQRYLSARLKAATAVNVSMLEFYWSIGENIERQSFANTYGSGFFKTMSKDLQQELPDVKGLFGTRYPLYAQVLFALCQQIGKFPASCGNVHFESFSCG